jgi:hypothetical protein
LYYCNLVDSYRRKVATDPTDTITYGERGIPHELRMKKIDDEFGLWPGRAESLEEVISHYPTLVFFDGFTLSHTLDGKDEEDFNTIGSVEHHLQSMHLPIKVVRWNREKGILFYHILKLTNRSFNAFPKLVYIRPKETDAAITSFITSGNNITSLTRYIFEYNGEFSVDAIMNYVLNNPWQTDDSVTRYTRSPPYIEWWNGTDSELISAILRHPACVVHFGAHWDGYSTRLTYNLALASANLSHSHPHIQFFKYNCHHPSYILPFCQRMGVDGYARLYYIRPNMSDEEVFSLLANGTEVQSLPRMSYSLFEVFAPNIIEYLTTPSMWDRSYSRPFNRSVAYHDEL